MELFGNHGPHHVSGIFGVVGNGADNFRKTDQMKYGHGIIDGIEDFFFDAVFELVGFMLILAQGANHIFDHNPLIF